MVHVAAYKRYKEAGRSDCRRIEKPYGRLEPSWKNPGLIDVPRSGPRPLQQAQRECDQARNIRQSLEADVL